MKEGVVLVTEKGAAEKWCQQTFSGTRAQCIGSGCMAWRWAESIPHICTKCGTEEAEWEDHPELRKGYCGLAGAARF
jgi:hypothetical protein